MNVNDEQPEHAARTTLSELAWVFLKLGTVGFGGPAAHIAMMEDEVVRRRQWLTREEFLDYLGATNLIPGPNSTELAIHIGHARAGWPGLIVAGACFILPAALIVTAIAWAYVRFGSLPTAVGILNGVKPVVIAVIVQALWRLARAALKTRTLVAVTLAATIAVSLGVDEVVVLVAAGFCVAMTQRLRTPRTEQDEVAALVPSTGGIMSASSAAQAAGATAIASIAFTPLFLTFLKIGSVLFGSGYVLLAFLRADFVERLHWLTERQLLDAVAVGQVTPGPVFTTATFIGYLLLGPSGAAVATLGIFLPAFFFVAVSGPLVPRLRRSPTAGAALDGVTAASLALMAIVTWQLGRSALVDATTVTLCVVSALLLIHWRINSAWLVLVGAVVGLIVHTRV
jgi:chromate transporter